MTAIKRWVVNLFRTEAARPFNPDTDSDILRWRSLRRDVRESRQQRRELWHERNAMERELLGERK